MRLEFKTVEENILWSLNSEKAMVQTTNNNFYTHFSAIIIVSESLGDK